MTWNLIVFSLPPGRVLVSSTQLVPRIDPSHFISSSHYHSPWPSDHCLEQSYKLAPSTIFLSYLKEADMNSDPIA